MSAIGRSVGIKSCVPLVATPSCFSAAGSQRVYLAPKDLAPPGCLLPKAQNPPGKHTPLLPPAQSPRLHLTLTLDAMGLIVCMYCTVVCQPPPRHPTSPNSFSVSSSVKKKGAGPTARNLYNDVLSGPGESATHVVVVESCSSVASKHACSALGIFHRPRHRVRAFFWVLPLGSAATWTVTLFVLCTGEARVRASYWQHVAR